MKKNVLAKRIKVKADLNSAPGANEESPNKKEDQVDENENDQLSEGENIYRCPNCFNIPLISVKDNENKVIIDCLKGHHTEMLFSEYMAPEFQKNIYKFDCGQCGANKSSKKNMKICYECQKILCKDCISLHNKNNANHHLSTLDKIDIICPIHKRKYGYYCVECKKNLCDECVKNKTDKHQMIQFNNINLKNNELNDLKRNLEKENQTLYNIRKIFNDTLNQLSNKFNDIISYKFLCLKYKNNIINTYETKDTNYQIIDNLNHLKFISKELKIEPEMNELDIIYELFNFLDSIEYNDEYNNANANNTNANNNNNEEENNYSNMNYGMNMSDKNKIMFDSKNKIEESENEDEDDENDNEKEDENKNKKGSNNIKVEENEKEDDDENEEEEKGEEPEKKKEEEDEDEKFNKIRNDYIKVNDFENENDQDKENENDNNENDENEKDKLNIINISNDHDGLVNQISPAKVPKTDSNKKEENEKDKNKEGKEKDKIKNKDEHSDNEQDDMYNDNDNEDNAYDYKNVKHIPVISDYSKASQNQDNSGKENTNRTEDTENKEKEIKKKKKKIIKKKKIKQPIKVNIQTEAEEKTINKTKKRIIKKVKSKDMLIPKKEEKTENIEQKENLNNNIHIEVNSSYSQDNNNANKEEKEKKKENEIKKNSYKIKITKNNIVNNIEEPKEEATNVEMFTKTEYQELSNDNNSNDYKLEEVPNTNHEEFNDNRIISKKIKTIKRKKKKRINLPQMGDSSQENKHIEIIKKIATSNPVNGFKIEENTDLLESSSTNKEIIESQIEKSLEEVNNELLNNDKENKSKTIKKTTITKKLNFGSSDKEEEEDDDEEDKILKNSKNFNNMVNINVKSERSSIENNQKSPLVRKKKKIKKKKFLISVDGKDNMNKSGNDDKQLKIIKTTTVIRSKSKDRRGPKITSSQAAKSVDAIIKNKKKITNEPTIKTKEINYKVLKTEKDMMNSPNYNATHVLNTKEVHRKTSKNNPKKSPNYTNSFNVNINKTVNVNKNAKDNLNNDPKLKEKEINFKMYKDETTKPSSKYNEGSATIFQKEFNDIKKIGKNNVKVKRGQKMRIAQGKNKVALLFENKEDIYMEQKDIKFAKKSGIRRFEEEIRDQNMNHSMDRVKHRTYKNTRMNNDYNMEEMNYLMERSNSYKKINKYKKFSQKEKINCIKFENGISCLLEVNPQIFALGNLIGDIILINYHNYKTTLIIKEHNGTIISLCLLHDNSILSCSADRKMLKIRINGDGTKYHIEYVFTGYENYILKGIELMNTFKIITCSWDDKLFIWENQKNNKGDNYQNTMVFNQGERVVDLLEVNSNFFVSVSENDDFKIWGSDHCISLYTIKNIKCIGAPNALCKLNDNIVSVLDYHEIQLIDVMEHKLVNKISVDDGNLSCIIKLNDNSILLAEDFNNDRYCVFYLKQFYYDDKDLKPISHKKDKFFKTNKNNDKEIRALAQFSNGVIVQGVTGEYNGKDSGDLFFYY